MAAKVLEGANLVWQRVNEIMYTTNSSPITRAGFLRELKRWLSTQKGNPKLQYVSFSAVAAHDTVTALTTGGATLYAIYAKVTKGSTDAISVFKLNDHGTTAGGASGANAKFGFAFGLDGDEVAILFQPGYVLATGITVAQETTFAGGTDASTTHGTSTGFCIVG